MDEKIVQVNFRTVFKPYIELASKNENMTLTEFINDCIRERLAKKTEFLADREAGEIAAKEMGISGLANTSIMVPEKYEEYRKRFWEHHARIKKELSAYFGNEGRLGENGEILEAPHILD
jgi:hypothetical protein